MHFPTTFVLGHLSPIGIHRNGLFSSFTAWDSFPGCVEPKTAISEKRSITCVLKPALESSSEETTSTIGLETSGTRFNCLTISRRSQEGVSLRLTDLLLTPQSILENMYVSASPCPVSYQLIFGNFEPGGAKILRDYSIIPDSAGQTPDASWAFGGGLNNHSRAAKQRMWSLRVAKLMRDSSQI